jgi:hypothetical protein
MLTLVKDSDVVTLLVHCLLTAYSVEILQSTVMFLMLIHELRCQLEGSSSAGTYHSRPMFFFLREHKHFLPNPSQITNIPFPERLALSAGFSLDTILTEAFHGFPVF